MCYLRAPTQNGETLMRTAAFALAFAALACGSPALADTRSDIAAIEQAWGQAFLKGDWPYLQKLVAPEFKLMGARNGEVDFTPRGEWLANAQGFVFHEYEVQTVDVVDAGDTAVATVTGRWKIGRKGMPGTRETRFIVSDTFVRRNGAWQVVYRHASPGPPVKAAAASQQRGR